MQKFLSNFFYYLRFYQYKPLLLRVRTAWQQARRTL